MSKQQNKPNAAAPSASEPKRASDFLKRLKEAEKIADKTVDDAFFLMLLWLHQSKASASEIAVISELHVMWKLENKKINTLREAVLS